MSAAMPTTQEDPFVMATPSRVPLAETSHNGSPSVFSSGSPAQARQALEAHIADTERRINDANRLGSTLLDQKKQLADQLREVETHQGQEEISMELQHKLSELEREWNDIGRQTARSFMPRPRYVSDSTDVSGTPHVYRGDARATPAKLQVPSKKKRNSSNRVHDIEFATEISTSLLAQVRSLQAVIAEKEDALRKSSSENTRLLSEFEALQARLRNLDDDEEKFKDVNWNLETQVQDLSAQVKDAAEREEKLTKSLNTLRQEKSSAQRDFEDIKQSHDRLSDDHAALQKHFDSELHGLRQTMSSNETSRAGLQRKVEELTSQNQELARAVAYRIKSDNESDTPDTVAKSLEDDDTLTPDNSPPSSPTKATPRHGGLEHETLKTSLTHAHRMIQNLKNNIHREKTEKVELRRMLQDARDELEAKQGPGGLAAAGGRKNKQAGEFKKPAQPSKLGGRKDASEEIWEDLDSSPKRQSLNVADRRRQLGTEQSDDYATATEASDAYATATENETSHGTDAFTTAESVGGEESDDLTETEAGPSSGSRHKVRSIVRSIESRPQPQPRDSYFSTASDEEEVPPVMTPPDNRQRFKVRLNRGMDRASESPAVNDSPASFMSNQSQRVASMNLAAELGGFGDGDSMASSTPSRSLASPETSPAAVRGQASRFASPEAQMAPAPLSFKKSETREMGTMTDSPSSQASDTASAGILGGIAGTVFGNSTASKDHAAANMVDDGTISKSVDSELLASANTSEERPRSAFLAQPEPQKLGFSSIESQSIAPVRPIPRKTVPMLPHKSLSSAPLANESRQREPSSPLLETHDMRHRQRRSIDESHKPRALASPESKSGIDVNNASAQTAITGEQIDKLTKGKNRSAVLLGPASPIGSPTSPTAPRPSSARRKSIMDTHPALRKSASANSLDQDVFTMPPLPSDHKETIAAASRSGSAHGISSSALNSPTSPKHPQLPSSPTQTTRPRTPGQPARVQAVSPASVKIGSLRTRAPSNSDHAHRDSVSSFATEIDERFSNLANGQVFQDRYDVPGTDPRMIAAITQTMIGEFLWKYTRKAGRGELSENRHRRFFWIHPYTRTLYWSTQDPGAAGRAELKAKSVPIEAVRVVSDDNIIPPGLYSKSIVIVTPGRNIKFTAQTSHRHDTWFNALSYLLLRGNGDQKQPSQSARAPLERSNTIGSNASADAADFEPQGRSTSRMTTHSHRSAMSTSNPARISNTPNFSHRAPSPQGVRPVQNYSSRTGQAQIRTVDFPQGNRSSTVQGQTQATADTNGGDRAGEFGEFKKPALPRQSYQAPALYNSPTKAASTNSINESPRKSSSLASKIGNSLGSFSRRGRMDSRLQDEERRRADAMEDAMDGYHQDTSAYSSRRPSPRRVENVRACCDGRHDVGHLHHRSTSRAASVTSVSRRSLSLRGSRSQLGDGEHV